MSTRSSRALITELRISHLRSFGHETVIRLRAGLNVIVGANGSGKSNALDAVLFALLQEPALLHVRSWAELTNRARVGLCAVRLTFALPSAEPRLVLLAHVKEDASRAFKLNGGTSTAAQAREALLELGIDTSVPSFCVRQHSASRPIDDAALTRLLLQASGAALWQAAAAHSRAQLVKERETLACVQKDIGAIEALLEREREAHAALCRLLQLRGRERRGRACMVSLAERLAASARESHVASLTEWRTRGARAQQVLAELEDTKVTQSARIATAATVAQRARADASAAALAVEEAAEVATVAEGEMLHAVVLGEQARRERAALAGQQERRQAAAHVSLLVGRRQRGALRAAREAAAEAEAARAEAQAACQRVAAATSGGWLVDGTLAQLRQQTQHRLRLECGAHEDASAAAAEARLRMEQAEAEARERADVLVTETARLADATEALQVAEARAAQAQAAAEMIGTRLRIDQTTGKGFGRGGGAGAGIGGHGLEMAAALAEAAAAAALERERQAVARLRLIDPEYHPAAAAAAATSAVAAPSTAPSLASVLRLASEDARLPRCLLALEVLAGRHLGVRLTFTAEAAVPLLEAARRRNEGVRVWPIASLRARAVPPASVAALQRRFGDQHVIAPAALIASAGPAQGRSQQWTAAASAAAAATGTGGGDRRDTAGTGGGPAGGRVRDGECGGGDDDSTDREPAEAGTEPNGASARGTLWAAVQHAFGSSLIISSDEIAEACLEAPGVVRCVTLAGTVHERAKLQGGYRDGAGQLNGFAALFECQGAAAAAAAATEHAESLARALATHRAAPRAATAAAAAAAGVERLAARLAQLRASHAHEHVAVGEAAAMLGEQSGRATAAASHAQRLQIDVAALDAIGSGGGEGVTGRSATIAVLRQLRARREEHAAAARALVVRLEEEARRRESAEGDGEAMDEEGDEEGGSAPRRKPSAPIAADADEDVEASALAEEEKEQQAALGHAIAELRHAERQLLLADRHAATASVASAAAAVAEQEVRAEGRRNARQIEAARVEAATAASTLARLSRSEGGAAAAGLVPDIALRWLDATAVLEDDKGDDVEDDEDGGVAEAETMAADTAAAPTMGDADNDDFQVVLGADADADALSACLASGELQLAAWLRERQELQRTHGSCAALRARLASARVLAGAKAVGGGGGGGGGGVNALDTLQQLQGKAHTVAASITTLTTGLEAMKVRVGQANVEAVSQVRQHTASLFATLVPSMQADIECDEPEDLETKGARFRIRAASRARSDVTDVPDGLVDEWRYGTGELSGGQRTLLNLALLLALARLRPCPLLLLDEMDAALDESNAAKVAALLAELSATCQVIAISHRVELHRAAHHIVRLHKDKEYTVVSEG